MVTRRCRGFVLVGSWLLLDLLASCLAVEPTASPSSSAGPERPATETQAVGGGATAHRIREGTKLADRVGEFQKTGDKVSFFASDGSGALRVLENLVLERVMRTLDDSPVRRSWSVSGVVTEFRGENYLLVTRAVFKAVPQSGTPVVSRDHGLQEERRPAE